MSDLVSYQRQGSAAVITIKNGKVNALSPQVFVELNAALDQAEKDQAVVVLSGQAGIFSGGYDLKVMMESREKAKALVAIGSRLTHRLLSFPTPVITACGGHAIAKGAFILLASDYRLGVAGEFKITLNEVAIGMTMHQAGIELCRGRLAPVYFNRAMINAEAFDPSSAITAGFLDAVVDNYDQLLPRALELAEQMAGLNMEAHHGTKLKARKSQLDALEQAIEMDVAGK